MTAWRAIPGPRLSNPLRFGSARRADSTSNSGSAMVGHKGFPRRGSRFWFGAIASAAALALLAGCGEEQGPLGPTQSDSRFGSAPVTTPDTRVDEIATGEPGASRRLWRPANPPAVNILGNLTASVVGGRSGPLVLAFASGVTAQLDRLADLRGQDSAGGNLGTLARLLGADPRAGVYVYLVTDERRSSSASAGGLCGAERPTHAAVSEFVDESGQWVMRIAAFRGGVQPGPAAAGEPVLCAVYNYVVN